MKMDPRNEDLESRLAAVEATVEAIRRRVARVLAANGAPDRGGAAERAGPPVLEKSLATTRRLEERFEELSCRTQAATDNHRTILAAQSAQLEEILDLLRQREEDVRALASEIDGLRQQHEDIASQLPILRQAFRAIDLRLRRLEGPRPARGQGAPAAGRQVQPGAAGTESAGRMAAEMTHGATSAPTPGGGTAGTAATGQSNQVAHLVHFEESRELRQSVQGLARKWSLHYHEHDTPLSEQEAGRRLLLVNLALTSRDPLEEIVNCNRWGIEQPAALTYCAHEGHGVVLGVVLFFPPPFDVDACVQRLLARPSRPKRLLVIGEDFESMNSLKDSLAQVQCGISMAFDTRQALDLIPMLKPDLALIDLTLPRGEALRLAARIRLAQGVPLLPLGFFWSEAIPPEEFRKSAVRAIRDIPLSADDLNRAINRSLAPDAPDA